MQVIVLASDFDNDYIDGFPAYLAEYDGKPFLEHLIDEKLRAIRSKNIFALPKKDVIRFKLKNFINQIVPDAKIIEIEHPTSGAACSFLLAGDQLDPDDQLIILGTTDLVQIDLQEVANYFIGENCVAGCVTFDSVHPRYSFMRLDDNGFVIEAAEKNPISRNASAGIYWFSKASYAIEAISAMIKKDVRTNDKFYLAPSFNELLLNQYKIKTFSIPKGSYKPMKSVNHVGALSFDAK